MKYNLKSFFLMKVLLFFGVGSSIKWLCLAVIVYSKEEYSNYLDKKRRIAHNMNVESKKHHKQTTKRAMEIASYPLFDYFEDCIFI